ncbi:MAG: ferredoxin-NADP reductase [Thermoanaerobaculia bacterium]|nr:ferredoxin-NADP reductase [Thermoanaerobaculia bacterium]
MQHLEEYDTTTRIKAKVISSERITPESSEEEVRELVLEVERGDFPHQVGQSVGVLAPGSAEFGNKEHFRLYSIADLPERGPSGLPRLKIAVRRCSYIDDYSGERYPGVASNYLCDLAPGAELTIAGPYGLAFEVPAEHDANLILIGSGTGIAPFRALVKHIHGNVPDWRGLIWLLFGAKSGLELLYMNEQKDDFAQYYDEETFRAFKALSPRPSWADPIAWDQAIEERGEELWEMLGQPKTYVYVAGLEKSIAGLDGLLARLAGSPEKWQRRKAELAAGKRWVELVY